jgi:hypothetical protein
MKKLVSGVILSSVLLAGSAAPALATGEGHTPVSYCHNGQYITTDDNGAINGHKTGRGIHANDVFAEDLGRPVEPADCKAPVPTPVAPNPDDTLRTETTVELHCDENFKVIRSRVYITKFDLDVEEIVWVGREPELASSSEVTQPTTVVDCPVVIPPHGEPAPTDPSTEPVPTDPTTTEPVTPEPTDEAYPAPPVVTNTVNGAVVEPVEPAPSGVEASTEPVATDDSAQLANTGADTGLIVWASIGFLTLVGGIFTVVRARRTA